MDLQPLGDRLIVEVLEAHPEAWAQALNDWYRDQMAARGRVLAVGPGARNDRGELIPPEVAEGDEIVFSKYGGTEFKFGTEEYLILRESDVLAKVAGGRAKAGSKKKEMAGATA